MNTEVIIAKIKQYPVAVGAIALTVVLLAALFIRKGGIPEMESRQEALEKEVNTIKFNEREAIKLDEDLEKLKELVSEIEAGTMNRSELTVNVAYFYSFEENNDLQIDSVNQIRESAEDSRSRGARQRDTFEVIKFTVQVEGSYDHLVQFAHDVRNGEKIARIESVGISPTAQNPERLRATFSINTLGKIREESESARG